MCPSLLVPHSNLMGHLGEFGDSVTVHCGKGYQLSTEEDTVNLTCGAEATWQPEAVECLRK